MEPQQKETGDILSELRVEEISLIAIQKRDFNFVKESRGKRSPSNKEVNSRVRIKFLPNRYIKVKPQWDLSSKIFLISYFWSFAHYDPKSSQQVANKLGKGEKVMHNENKKKRWKYAPFSTTVKSETDQSQEGRIYNFK